MVWFMVFNATVNNISVILWRSILLVEETGVHKVVKRTPHRVAIGIDCKSNYPTIMTKTSCGTVALMVLGHFSDICRP